MMAVAYPGFTRALQLPSRTTGTSRGNQAAAHRAVRGPATMVWERDPGNSQHRLQRTRFLARALSLQLLDRYLGKAHSMLTLLRAEKRRTDTSEVGMPTRKKASTLKRVTVLLRVLLPMNSSQAAGFFCAHCYEGA